MKGSFHSYSCDTSDRYLIHVYLIIVSIGLAYLVQLICNSVNKEIPWWLGVPGIFSIYGGLYFFFSISLWKIRLFRVIFFIKTPMLEGLYSGVLKSSHQEFKTEKKADIEITQTWDRILICLRTDTSQSCSQSCSISLKDHPTPTISYLYLNEPGADSLKSMEIHYGMCMLSIKNQDLYGDFFTGRGRQTYGTIKTEKQS